MRAARNDLIQRDYLVGERIEYAFLRQHVQRATSVADLIRRAIVGFYGGQLSAKSQTARIVYGDVDRLRAALALAEGEENPE